MDTKDNVNIHVMAERFLRNNPPLSGTSNEYWQKFSYPKST
jgi:hypothetical protein